MSVLIKGMKMPDNCESCAFESGFGFCLAKSDNFCGYTNAHKRPEWCPMVEVPTPHGRLIDADALADDLDYDANHYEEDHEMKSNCASWLRSNATPTVIEAEDEE